MARKQKFFIEKISPQTLARIIACSFFAALAALSWDGWWHVSVGRDSFWIPPHVMLYAAVAVVIAAAIVGMRVVKDALWKQLLCMLSLLVLAAPFDEVWHRIFGKESINSIAIIWSPPHLLLIGSLMASMLLLMPLIQKDRNAQARYFLTSMLWGAVLYLGIVLTVPFMPRAPYEILGFWGAGIIALVLASALLLIQRSQPLFASATLSIVFFLLLYAIGTETASPPDINVIPHAHAPSWLFIASFLVPAVIVDLTSRFRSWFQGGLVGVMWAGIFYTFAACFFPPEFRYHANQAIAAIMTSGMAGILAGFIADLYQEKDSDTLA